jgi:hypothetical protein
MILLYLQREQEPGREHNHQLHKCREHLSGKIYQPLLYPFSVLIPSSSKPIPSIFAETPTALNNTSASNVVSPSEFSLLLLRRHLKFNRCYFTVGHDGDAILFKILISSFEISSSSTGTTLGKNSTIVTFVPRLL